MTPQRIVALEAIGARQGMVRELAALAEVSDAVIRGLVNTGALEAVTVSADQPYPEPDSGFAPPDLSGEQTAAAAQLRDAVHAAKFDTLLLDGVTGSGKTEVYMEAIAAAVDGKACWGTPETESSRSMLCDDRPPLARASVTAAAASSLCRTEGGANRRSMIPHFLKTVPFG